jgi:hypothetical protein
MVALGWKQNCLVSETKEMFLLILMIPDIRCSAKSQRQEWRIDVDMDRERGRQPRMDKSTGKPVNNVIRVVIKCTGEINMAVIKAYLDRKME